MELTCANKYQEQVCKVKIDLGLGQRNEKRSKNAWIQCHFVVGMIGVLASRMQKGGFGNSCQRLRRKKKKAPSAFPN